MKIAGTQRSAEISSRHIHCTRKAPFRARHRKRRMILDGVEGKRLTLPRQKWLQPPVASGIGEPSTP
jgi:hypothetical protein